MIGRSRAAAAFLIGPFSWSRSTLCHKHRSDVGGCGQAGCPSVITLELIIYTHTIAAY